MWQGKNQHRGLQMLFLFGWDGREGDPSEAAKNCTETNNQRMQFGKWEVKNVVQANAYHLL